MFGVDQDYFRSHVLFFYDLANTVQIGIASIAGRAVRLLLLRGYRFCLRSLLVVVGQGMFNRQLREVDHRNRDRRNQSDPAANRQREDCLKQAPPQFLKVLPEGHRAALEEIVIGTS